ncbi:hypothetical protein GR183_07350 [Stappia sp. GBMRC 2046]|uniref:Uncharacterized protein n=1 Tax=Stappia sediminis TaxID=2692190 RepID=A0A7X3LTB5_9HYPH|nr:hypothetical protein [Stappia sediminis]MXN64717.1 hypothetical protein [Stappia sediminis]
MYEFISIAYDIIGYWTARLIVPMASFGRIQVQTMSSNERGFNTLGLKRRPGGTFLLQDTVAGWVGCGFWLLALAVYLAV